MRRFLPWRGDPLYTPGVWLLLIAVGLSFIGTGFVMPILSLYAREVGATSGDIGLMTSAWLLTGFAATPLIGAISDRVGHGRVLRVALLLHVLVTLAYIPSRSPELLIALRAIEGVVTGGVLPPARALLNGLAPANRQGEALGAFGAAQMVGFLLGPAAGSVLADWVGYESAFVLAAAALLASAVAVWLWLPARGAGHAHVEAASAPAGGFSGAFSPTLLLSYGLRFTLSAPHGAFAAIWSLFMLDRGASLPVIGLSFTAFALPALFVAPITGRISDRRGRYWPVLLGTLATSGLYAAYALPIGPYEIIVVSLIEGITAMVAFSAADGLLADATPAEARGRVQANYSAAGLAGSFAGATASGFLYDLGTGTPFLASAVITLATGLVLLLPSIAQLVRHPRSAPEEPAVEARSAA